MSDLTLPCYICEKVYFEKDMNWHCENPICHHCKKKIQKYLKNQKEILVKKVIKNNLTQKQFDKMDRENCRNKNKKVKKIK